MTYTSISRAANDPQLHARVDACINQIAITDPELGNTQFGKQVKQGLSAPMVMMWAVAVATEDDYQAAIMAGNGSPGFDETVIADDEIMTTIKLHWPYADGEMTATEPEAP